MKKAFKLNVREGFEIMSVFIDARSLKYITYLEFGHIQFHNKSMEMQENPDKVENTSPYLPSWNCFTLLLKVSLFEITDYTAQSMSTFQNVKPIREVQELTEHDKQWRRLTNDKIQKKKLLK